MLLPGTIVQSNSTLTLEKFKLAARALDRERTLLWIKALFFGGFASVALGGYALSAVYQAPLGQVFSAAGGLFITVCWIATCMAARYWESVWEARVHFLEDQAIGILFKVDEGGGRRHPLKTGLRLSVPVILIVFCSVLLAAFGALLLYPLVMNGGAWRPEAGWRIALAILVVALFAVASYGVLRLSRTATRQPPQGLIEASVYLDRL
ncbi:hypothetical protein sos41_09360 [Alphaproteobacteria bacterium SO-S41]|nr:hypothetical protein sos41_09360 [Alphaproteobacteria bacterium SO-S41]